MTEFCRGLTWKYRLWWCLCEEIVCETRLLGKFNHIWKLLPLCCVFQSLLQRHIAVIPRLVYSFTHQMCSSKYWAAHKSLNPASRKETLDCVRSPVDCNISVGQFRDMKLYMSLNIVSIGTLHLKQIFRMQEFHRYQPPSVGMIKEHCL